MAHAVWSLAVIEVARSCLLLVPASAAYSVVADVERYPDFLPACDSVTILSRELDSLGTECIDAEVLASKAGANFTFVTRNTGVLNEAVSVVLIEGPFDALEGAWHFKSLGEEGCRVDFRLASSQVVCFQGSLIQSRNPWLIAWLTRLFTASRQ